MANIQNELNEIQYNAATSIDRASLIIAGAGSGKTRTLTYRIA
ncbi:MAG: UvrD-helicase domain-containing protein, partial [Prevotellaceae bacterium]|nr:UvrD-helicase domain-containing protein [Prevotellaceae bacterium]